MWLKSVISEALTFVKSSSIVMTRVQPYALALALLCLAAPSGAIRADNELEANQTQLELDQFGCVGTWCCDKIKCEGTKSTAANYEPVFYKNCEKKPGKWTVDGTVVTPGMVQGSVSFKLDSRAPYMCEEECSVYKDTGAIRPPQIYKKTSVYRGGGAGHGENGKAECVFGTMWLKLAPDAKPKMV